MVTSSYPRFPGDIVAPFIEEIAHSVADRGHDVDVVLPHHPQLQADEDGRVRLLPVRYAPTDALSIWGYGQSLESDVRLRRRVYFLLPAVALAVRRRVARLLREHAYDVVNAHWVVPNGVLIADLVHRRRVPFVVSLHGSDVFIAERLRPAGHLAARTLRGADAVTACSGDLSRRALLLGGDPERMQTIPYGVDTNTFSPEKANGDMRARLGGTPGALLVVAIGRLVEKKGFRYLVEAAANSVAIQVVIIGDGDLRSALKRQAAELGDRVRLVGGLSRDLVPAALASADVLAVPSVVDAAGNVDGLPNALLESLASGRPVVASRVGGIPDVLEDDVNGLLVPPNDPDAIAAALKRLQNEPETRSRLGREARRTAAERLTWEVAAESFEECYSDARSRCGT
jgi:glycosyltransferase involved in cell wall biosynthesis